MHQYYLNKQNFHISNTCICTVVGKSNDDEYFHKQMDITLLLYIASLATYIYK